MGGVLYTQDRRDLAEVVTTYARSRIYDECPNMSIGNLGTVLNIIHTFITETKKIKEIEDV